MPSIILKSATLLLVASIMIGCVSSQSPSVTSSTMPAHALTGSSDHSDASATRPASVDETVPKAGATEFVSCDSHLKSKLVSTQSVLVDSSIDGGKPASSNGFALDTLIGMALSSNPAIAQAETVAAQAVGVHCQVGLKPNPTVGYFGQEIGNDGSGGQHGLFASQTIVRGDKLQWNRCVTSHDVNRLNWEAEAQRRRTETDVRIRFYRALAAQQRLQRARDFRENAATAVDFASQRLNAREGTKPDLLQSQLLVDEIDLSIRQSELEWDAAWAELAATIGEPLLQPTRLIGDFWTEEGSDVLVRYDEAVAASPLLFAARARIDRARSNLQRQRNQVIPNLNVQMGLGIDDATDDRFANVQLGMPVPIHNHNQGNITAAHAEYAAAIQNLRRLELRLRRDMAAVLRRYQSSAVAITKYEDTMLPRAEESLALIEEAQRAGEIDFLRVLTARQSVFDLQQKLITARGELSQAAAEMKGYLLTDALGTEVAFEGDDGLRGQALSGQ